MNTKQYYYLAAIADYGNLSYAAQALHVSPSALSKFLTECERTFGFSLFLRYNRHLYPTAVGRYVIECAHKILDQQNRMLLTMKDVTGRNRQVIRLATAPNRGAIIFSKIYNQFSRRYPDISLQLVELYAAEQPGAIARGAVDVALGAGAISTEVTDVPIAYEELLVSLPSAHPLSKQSKIRLKDLQDTPFVLQSPRHSIRIIAEQLFREVGFQPVVAFESGDVILLDSMMHQAVGVGLVSNAHVFPCEELAYRPLDPPVYQTLHLRFPRGHTLTDPERYLAGLLVAERLADPRYQATDEPLVQELLEEIRSPAERTDADHLPPEPMGTALRSIQDVNLDTKVMEYLIAIVEEKSLSLAADRYFLAQSALSRHLRSVEKMVNTLLFTREHNRLRPTSAGAIFVNNSRNILRIENEMFEHVRSYRQGNGGHIYLCCDPLFVPLLQTKLKPAFSALHPDISLEIQEADQEQTLESLQNSSADLGLFLSTTASSPLMHCETLALTEIVYCFAPHNLPENWAFGSPLPKGQPLAPQLLAQCGTTLRAEQDALLAELSPEPVPTACEAQMPILCRLVEAGIADSLIPLNFLAQDQYYRCATLEPPRPLYLLLAHHAGRTFPATVQELCSLIRTAFADSPVLPVPF